MPNTVRLHRVLRSPPERVYRAFLDADAKAKWLPPNGFTGKVHHSDARVGGTYKMSFTNFTTGKSHSFGGKYTELVPHERIRYTDTFDDPNLPGEMQVTVNLKKVSVGTEREHRAGGDSRHDPRRGVLSRLAGIAHAPGEAGRGGDSGVAQGSAEREERVWTSTRCGQSPIARDCEGNCRRRTSHFSAMSFLWSSSRSRA